MDATSRAAAKPVCGSRQHLPVRRGGQCGRTTGWPAAPNPVWTGDETTGGGTDPGQQPASQGTGGTDERGVAGPAGQSPATGGPERFEGCQRIFGQRVSASLQPEVSGVGSQRSGCASKRSAEAGGDIELGSPTGGPTGLDGGQRREVVSTGSATRSVKSGGQKSNRADVAGRANTTGKRRGEIALERTGPTPRARQGQGGRSGEKSRSMETGFGPSVAQTADWSRDPHQDNDTCPWGTTVGLRYAPASLRPPRAGETNRNNNQGDIIS